MFWCIVSLGGWTLHISKQGSGSQQQEVLQELTLSLPGSAKEKSGTFPLHCPPPLPSMSQIYYFTYTTLQGRAALLLPPPHNSCGLRPPPQSSRYPQGMNPTPTATFSLLGHSPQAISLSFSSLLACSHTQHFSPQIQPLCTQISSSSLPMTAQNDHHHFLHFTSHISLFIFPSTHPFLFSNSCACFLPL